MKKTFATKQARVKQPNSLSNTFGFWELTFNSRCAVVPQDQALFYVAWLLAHPPLEPLPVHELAAKVFETFRDHPDFEDVLPWIAASQDQALVASTLLSKQSALHAILDDPDELEPIKAEALRDLAAVLVRQETCVAELTGAAGQTARIVSDALLRLLATLATAVDPLGNPHPVLRPFGRHLLLYLLIPSIRASKPAQARVGLAACFTYDPPPNISWLTEFS